MGGGDEGYEGGIEDEVCWRVGLKMRCIGGWEMGATKVGLKMKGR